MADMLRISPVDTLMFRDGRPFNQDDEGAGAAESLFPPPPPTLAGAVRLAIAQQTGFPENPWPKNLVGHGVDWQSAETTLGPLRFGPLTMELDGKRLLPAPAHLGKDADDAFHLLQVPDTAQFTSDKASTDGSPAVFPRAATGVDGFKVLKDCWLTFSGMVKVIRGRIPEKSEVIEADELFARESRVGIGVALASRRASDGHLYMARFLRLHDGAAFNLEVQGLPDDLKSFVQRLGGEHRHAEFQPHALNEAFPSPESNGNAYAAIAISPVFLNSEPESGEGIAGLPGKLVTACIPKPFLLGGWDSRRRDKDTTMRPGPLPLKPIIPAGAVFFMRCEPGESPPRERLAAGLSTAWGFGHCLVGK